MKVEYDKYYQTENLFGEPYPELVKFYSTKKPEGKLLDVGCGQGRNFIALARLGYDVIGIDHSKVGIQQLKEIAKKEHLPLIGIVGDIYEYTNFGDFDFVLLDSIFHFGKRGKEKETQLLKGIIEGVNPETLITICIQNSGNKLKVLNSIIAGFANLETVSREALTYKYVDKA